MLFAHQLGAKQVTEGGSLRSGQGERKQLHLDKIMFSLPVVEKKKVHLEFSVNAERIENMTDHVSAAAGDPETVSFNPFHGMEDFPLPVGMPEASQHIAKHGWDWNSASVRQNPVPATAPAAAQACTMARRVIAAKRQQALTFLNKFLDDLSSYREVEAEELLSPLGPLHRGEVPPNGEDNYAPPLEDLARPIDLEPLSQGQSIGRHADGTASFLEERWQGLRSSNAPRATIGWVVGKPLERVAPRRRHVRQSNYAPIRLRGRGEQHASQSASFDVAGGDGGGTCNQRLAVACMHLAGPIKGAGLVGVRDGNRVETTSRAALEQAAEAGWAPMDDGKQKQADEAAIQARLPESQAAAAEITPVCTLPSQPRREFELLGCTVDGCRDYMTLPRATAACAEMGSSCGGVTRTAAGQYHTRASHRGAQANAGAATWAQTCLDLNTTASASVANEAASAGSDPCSRYAQLVGGARWRAMKAALLRLLQARGRCTLEMQLSDVSAAQAKVRLLAAGDTAGLAAPGKIALSSYENEVASQMLQHATRVYDTPPEVRRLTEGDGSFVPGEPLEMWEPLRHYRTRVHDVGEIRENPWRNNLNCTCSRRPPGNCTCVQYAECVAKLDATNTLVTLGRPKLQISNDYGTFIDHSMSDRMYKWNAHRPVPAPVIYTFDHGIGSEAASLLQEAERQQEAVDGRSGGDNSAFVPGMKHARPANRTQRQAKRPVNRMRLAQSWLSERGVAQHLSKSFARELEQELMTVPYVGHDEPACVSSDDEPCPVLLQTDDEESAPNRPVQGKPREMYSTYDQFLPHSREKMDCTLSRLKCNCSHSCECQGALPDRKPWWSCWTAWQNIPWPWPLRVRCEDEGLQATCGRETICNRFGRMDNLDALEKSLGAPMKRKCLDMCRCATITCWGMLWF